ncbi:hypothetical protein [Sorangium cellulosum]|uniref:Secreted protein n=1 Tax=Sorangium cellulosum TaxID=56 RepID=A0A150QBR5_SORCE|nr:hypothetical protein [Sorangium cellulosum]KYF65048.1 hypothetical protein BE15_28935 [Sorangium cellulosum]
MGNRLSLRRGSLAVAIGIIVSLAGAGQARADDAPPPAPPPMQQQPLPAPQAPPPPGFHAAPGVAPAGPKVLPWREGEPVPPGYQPETRVRKGLVISGAIVFGTVYLFTAIGGADAVYRGSSGYAALFVPVAGPFLTLATTRQDDLETMALVLDGLVQITGAALLLPGLLVPKTVLVRDDVGKAFVVPVPMSFGPSSAGLGLVGRF